MNTTKKHPVGLRREVLILSRGIHKIHFWGLVNENLCVYYIKGVFA